MLESQSKFSLDDVKRMKFNTKMLMADRIKSDLIKTLKAVPSPSDDLLKGLAVIEAWDNTASADAKGAVLFQRFATSYLDATKKPYAVEWNRGDPARTPSGISGRSLAFWDYFLDWLGYRFPKLHRLVRPAPSLLIKDGRIQRRNLRHEMITEEELMAELRQNGVETVGEVAKSYLEGDGHISVIKKDSKGDEGKRKKRTIA